MGRFSSPPRVEDLAVLTFEEGDFKAARECKPGDCDLKMARSAMDRVRGEIDWKHPEARARVTSLVKRMMVEFTDAYIRGGTAAMATYEDKDHALETPAEFRKLLATSPYLMEYVPAFHRYVEDFPKGALGGAEDAFHWTKDKFGPKATISIYHTTVWRDPAPTGRALIASKRIYASHYFRGGLDILAVVPAPGGGFYLMDLYRARIDPPTGMLSGVLLGKVRGGIESGVAEGLKAAQARAVAK
jgi:hypothetical protein